MIIYSQERSFMIQMEKQMAERLKELLEKQEMSQKALAVKAGITEAAVSHYLNGDRAPRGAILLNIANALGVSTDYLLDINLKDNNSPDDIEKSYRLLARNAKQLTLEQKTKFLTLLLQEGK